MQNFLWNFNCIGPNNMILHRQQYVPPFYFGEEDIDTRRGKEGGDPEIRGKGGGLKKIWSKNKGGLALDPPLPARYLTPTNQSTYRSGSISGLTSLLNPVIPSIIVKKDKKNTCVRAARKVSTYWLHKTMTCHSFNCFSIVSGQC